MKELTIEQKAKAYDEALQRTRKWWDSNTNEGFRGIFEEIFPELKESEDERIMKAIGYAIGQSTHSDGTLIIGVSSEEALAWLDKRGEQKINDDDKAILENWEGIVKDNKEKWQLSDWFVEATLSLVQKIEQIGLPKSIIYNNKTMLNACINTLRNVGHPHLAVWLEKQGEQHPKFRIGDTIKKKSTGDIVTISEIDLKNREYRLSNTGFIPFKYEHLWELVEQKSVDKVEPKFRVEKDKWYVCISQYCNCIEGRNYKASLDGRIIDDYGTEYDIHDDAYRWFRPWTIQDAKPGDVLVCEDFGYTSLMLFESFSNGRISLHCWYNSQTNNFHINSDVALRKDANIYPATKEQRDLLFQKMKESGYEWDSEKLELIKIKQNITSKFKIGDSIEPIDSCLGSPRTIYKICDGWYETDQGTLNFEFENNWRLIEQKPVIEMKTPEKSLGIDSDTYNKIVDECVYGEQKPANKIEPKFKVGDWVVSPNGVYWHIDAIRDGRYQVSSNSGYSADWSLITNIYHRFTIQDAKPGDVLVDQNGEMPFIFKECKNNHIYCYCGYTNRKDIFFDRFVDSEGEELHWLNLYHEQAYPATKAQRDLLFQKMKEKGYEWDADQKKLEKIKKAPQKFMVGDTIRYNGIEYKVTEITPIGYKVYAPIYDEDAASLISFSAPATLVEQKPARSEEDETKIKSIIALLKSPALCTMDGNKGIIDESIKYLKSLKDRVQPQPNQEWSGEDEGYYDAIISKLEVTQEDALLTDNEMNFLKSLKDRVQLKQEWSEKDKHMLQKVIDFMKHPDLIKVTPTLSKSTINWLEFLEERYTWKPSDEQMEVFRDLIEDNNQRFFLSILKSLYNDLKKLKGE